MPMVRVSWYAGRTLEQKRQVAEAITRALMEHGGASRSGTQVVFEDVPKENWITGGVPELEKAGAAAGE